VVSLWIVPSYAAMQHVLLGYILSLRCRGINANSTIAPAPVVAANCQRKILSNTAFFNCRTPTKTSASCWSERVVWFTRVPPSTTTPSVGGRKLLSFTKPCRVGSSESSRSQKSCWRIIPSVTGKAKWFLVLQLWNLSAYAVVELAPRTFFKNGEPGV